MKSNVLTGAIALIAFLSINSSSFAHVKMLDNGELQVCEFAPENNLRIPVGVESNGLTEEEYQQVMDKFEDVYAPIVKSMGGKLKLKRLWSNDTVNASATTFFRRWIINAYGGLARFPGMTQDGEMMVMCHEMGHHIGGFPTYPGATGLFGHPMSNEGQADYFAATKCFRRIVQDENNVLIMSKVNVPKEVQEACAKGFKTSKEIAVCERASMAGEVLGNILHQLGLQGGNGEPSAALSFSTPDKSEVTKTDDRHPHGQCRMDTYFAGSICAVSMDTPFSSDGPIGGACAEENKAQYGFRPHCWYKPQI